MRFADVRLAGLSWLLPEERVSSDGLEERLTPLYDRLRLRRGRLELMSGIRERRFWPPGTRPSGPATDAGRLALERAQVAPGEVELLVHASVCRDFLEPATASVVHHGLGLSSDALLFDLSNACLGFANGLLLAAAQIDAGQIRCALVVACEDGRPLVEETIAALLSDPRIGKEELKRAFASLTIGSGAAAAVLVPGARAPHAPRLLGGKVQAATEHHVLCHGDRPEGGGGPLMETDSEALLVAGIDLARRTWPLFLEELGWERSPPERIVTHQVGVAHRRALLDALGVDPARDYPTVEHLGNMGSVSLPLTLAQALESGHVAPGQRVGALGIGSGLSCLMLGLERPPV